MPKLNKKKAAEVAKTEGMNFDPVPQGWYHVRLREVDGTPTGPAGPYWKWEYEVVGSGSPDDDGSYATKHKNRRLWNNTTLAEGKMFGFKQTFDAFGVDTDTDTDDLCGQVIKAKVGHRTIQKGPRAGEIGEQIDQLAPADEEFVLPEGDASSGEADDPEDIFD